MKKFFWIALLPLAGCVGGTVNTEAGNKELVNKVFKAFNKHDWKQMCAYYTEPAEFLSPSLGKEYVQQTREQHAREHMGLQEYAPDVKDSIVGMYASGDKVIVEFISSGTSQGQKWSLPLCDVFTIKDGMITRDATYFDR